MNLQLLRVHAARNVLFGGAIMNMTSEPTGAASLALEAFQALAQPIGLMDPSGALLANPAFAAMFGDHNGGLELPPGLAFVGPTSDRSSLGPFSRPDGRKFRLTVTPLSAGNLIAVEELVDEGDASRSIGKESESALPDRRTFRESLGRLLRERDKTQGASVLVIGLGRLKAIGTSLGSEAGKALLHLVADRLRSAIRSADRFGRIGDDEFAIFQVHPEQPQSAAALAERLVDLLGRAYLSFGHLIDLDVCIGVATIPGDGEDCGRLLDQAVLALSKAREDGPGQIRFFEASLYKQSAERLALEGDLRRALAMREFSLAYQPQFNLASGEVDGFEALLRWRHPKRGLVSPADFIPLAEDLGLITAIGEWVLRKACREAANWPDRMRVAVNVSAVQFRNAKLCDQVSATLAESGLDPCRLELEITEGVLLGDHASVLADLHGLRAMGVRVSMDDFGTGYSSLSYLHSFPFDKIKIDQSFVRGEIDEASSTAIIRAIAAMGKTLGMSTTAEGVETAEQLSRVASAGCTDIQGYLISRPIPPEEVASFLDSRKRNAAALAAE